MNTIINQVDLTNIYRTLYPTIAEDILFWGHIWHLPK